MASTTKKIDAYLESNSPWSYMAFTWLRRNRKALADHGVTIDFHPIFLGGINVGSGNKPPWTLPAKAEYGKLDLPRAIRYFDVPTMTTPPCMPILSLLPSRCMLYVKDNYPAAQYEDAFYELWHSLWRRHEDISKPDMMAKCLSLHFGDEDVQKILQGGTDPHYKKLLTDETARLVAKGAFGAPWFLVTDKTGKEEPFFGSDRFHFMMQYLDVPFRDIEIQSPGSSAKL